MNQEKINIGDKVYIEFEDVKVNNVPYSLNDIIDINTATHYYREAGRDRFSGLVVGIKTKYLGLFKRKQPLYLVSLDLFPDTYFETENVSLHPIADFLDEAIEESEGIFYWAASGIQFGNTKEAYSVYTRLKKLAGDKTIIMQADSDNGHYFEGNFEIQPSYLAAIIDAYAKPNTEYKTKAIYRDSDGYFGGYATKNHVGRGFLNFHSINECYECS